MKIRLVGAELFSADRRTVCVPCWLPKHKLDILLTRKIPKCYKNYRLRILWTSFYTLLQTNFVISAYF